MVGSIGKEDEESVGSGCGSYCWRMLKFRFERLSYCSLRFLSWEISVALPNLYLEFNIFQWCHPLASISHENPKNVTAHFSNSSSGTDTLLIGADGFYSPRARSATSGKHSSTHTYAS